MRVREEIAERIHTDSQGSKGAETERGEFLK